ncbi:MAG: Uma2 family endonuclease [Anaerolineae bacterium]
MQRRIKTEWTLEEYHDYERTNEGKSEYLNSAIYDMVGASEAHNLITSNTIVSLGGQVRGSGCKVYPSDMRLRTPSGFYAYPDVMVICGASQIANEGNRETMLNPTVIIEVLSPSTEMYDRTTKFAHYRSLESLQTFLMIAQDKPYVECFTRHSGDQWLVAYFSGLDQVCDLPSVGCKLALADLYENVSFELPA